MGPVFPDVLSHVFNLTVAVMFSLNKADAPEQELQAGPLTKGAMIDPDGNVTTITQAPRCSDVQSNPVTTLAQAGGAVKLSEPRKSSVALAESSIGMPLIGYLGFDVPRLQRGDIGSPIPTFQRLTATS